jgi:hypothetical protein
MQRPPLYGIIKFVYGTYALVRKRKTKAEREQKKGEKTAFVQWREEA